MNEKLYIYKQDRRYRTGERLVRVITYKHYMSGYAMADEAYAYRQQYKKADGYRVDW